MRWVNNMKLRLNVLMSCACLLLAGNVYAANKPNVVIMMVDNLGWGEIGTYGGGILRGARTPNLDNMANEGLKLLNFNVEPQCTPSRSALMTGRHPIRSGTTKVVWGMLYGMTQWEKTMPELFSEAGYATGMFGKWHLGNTPGRFPTDQGFDEWYGIPDSTDEVMYPTSESYDPTVARGSYIMQGRKGKKVKKLKPYTIKERPFIDGELTKRTIDFMERKVKAKQPFFAFVPFTQPHLPTIPHPDFKGRTGKGDYADVLEEIDHRAGQILKAIKKLGVDKNTIVIWTSDNGPEQIEGYHGTAGFWRGNYFTALEGSLRTSFLMRWPGKVPAKSVNNEIVHISDLLPTLSKVAGYKVPADRVIDGKDQLDFFLGKQKKSNREGFPIYNGDNLFAYKWRDYKIHFVELESMFAAPKKLNMPKMHNLIKDPKELYPLDKTNVADAWFMPVVLEKLVAHKKTFIKEQPIQLGTPDPYEPKK
ncbi:MAG: arylsulfatase [Gammaproteobacteria bacterium]|nr:arylsulfatase [Gammaproteobacteria bacterium]